ncbi:MAG: hypothetical protein ACXWLE_11890, partial [Rhizomicrobium sp.]
MISIIGGNAEDVSWPGFTTISKRPWSVEQTLVDPEDHNDWSVKFEIEFAEDGAAKLRFEKL